MVAIVNKLLIHDYLKLVCVLTANGFFCLHKQLSNRLVALPCIIIKCE